MTVELIGYERNRVPLGEAKNGRPHNSGYVLLAIGCTLLTGVFWESLAEARYLPSLVRPSPTPSIGTAVGLCALYGLGLWAVIGGTLRAMRP